ncbi:MAG: hypothetical protein K2Z81_19890 [Cyanobacteria bacterium]|nr:hypothetical protein [Cyanobacteriota bacterium]
MTGEKLPRKTYLRRHQVLFEAAAIGAHARFAKHGFRQKDLRFLIELFSNWLEASLEGPTLAIENTQIARYLEALVHEGFAKKTGGETRPLYHLTRTGLMEQLAHLAHRSQWWPIEEFFFVYYFLESYRDRIEALIANAGTLYTGPMKLEIHQWLDLRNFVERQEQLLDREIAKLDLRIADSRKTTDLVKRRSAEGKASEDILKEIHEKVPYQLNNQKPMKDLFRETPDENWLWEMEVGSEKRMTRIFIPLKDLLVHLRGQVTRLKTEAERKR